MLSKQNRLVVLAFDKGYRVSECGEKIFNPKGKELKTHSQCKKGKYYRSFNIMCPVDKNVTRVYLHKLQAYQLFGEKMFEPDMVVRHMNDISTDNSQTNLKLGTQMVNMMDKINNKYKDDDCPF